MMTSGSWETLLRIAGNLSLRAQKWARPANFDLNSFGLVKQGNQPFSGAGRRSSPLEACLGPRWSAPEKVAARDDPDSRHLRCGSYGPYDC